MMYIGPKNYVDNKIKANNRKSTYLPLTRAICTFKVGLHSANKHIQEEGED